MEYIRISGPAREYARKNLYYSQISVLKTVEMHRKYKALRKEELNLKDLLKKKTTELKNEIVALDKILHKVKNEDMLEYKSKKTAKKRSDLEMEIDAIRRKIASLQ